MHRWGSHDSLQWSYMDCWAVICPTCFKDFKILRAIKDFQSIDGPAWSFRTFFHNSKITYSAEFWTSLLMETISHFQTKTAVRLHWWTIACINTRSYESITPLTTCDALKIPWISPCWCYGPLTWRWRRPKQATPILVCASNRNISCPSSTCRSRLKIFRTTKDKQRMEFLCVPDCSY